MLNIFRNFRVTSGELASSQLFNQDKFYDAFSRDLRRVQTRVIIESPFITVKRLNVLLPTLRCLRARGVSIIVNTKPLDEHDQPLYEQALRSIAMLQEIEVTVLMTVGHHRKLAIIDDDILWEGSLNILSQNDSCEFMRRMKSSVLAEQMIRFICADKWS